MWIEQSAYKRLGRLLSDARREADLTQAELAARLRKPQSFVSSIESGQRRVDLLEFVRIAACLGVDAPKLFRRLIKAVQRRAD